MRTKIIFVGVLLLSCCLQIVLAQNDVQDLSLAEEYFGREEYDKASEIYERLSRNNRNLPLIYKNYLRTLYALKDFKESEKLIKKQIKLEPENPMYPIDYGYWWQLQDKEDKAKSAYDAVINDYKDRKSVV